MFFVFKVYLNFFKWFFFCFWNIEVDEKYSEKCEIFKELECFCDGEFVDEYVKWKSDKEGVKLVEESGNIISNFFGFYGEYFIYNELGIGILSYCKFNDIYGDVCYSYLWNVRVIIGYVGIWYGIDCNEEVEIYIEVVDIYFDVVD